MTRSPAGVRIGSPWQQAPVADTGSAGRSAFVGVLIVVWTGVFGPFVRALNLPASEPGQVLITGLVGAAAMVVATKIGWWARLLVAASVAVYLVPDQGEAIAIWMAAGLLVGAWVGFEAPPLPKLPTRVGESTAPVVVLMGVAAWQGSDEAKTWQPFIPLALACAVPLLGSFGGGALHRAAAWLGEKAGQAVSTVLFGILSIPAVVIPWMAQRALRIDPLEAPGVGWTERERRPLQAERPWTTDPSVSQPPLSRRLRLPAAILAIAAIGFGAVWVHRTNQTTAPQASTQLIDATDSTTAQDSSWYPEYREDIEWVLDERVALRPFEIYRLLDV